MNYDVSRFGGGGGTSVSPLGIAIVAVILVLLFVLPRKKMLVAFLVGALLMPLGQKVVVAGVHLMTYRILILFCWVRLFMGPSSERTPRGSHPLDRAFVFWALSNAIIFTILWGEAGALFNKLGFLYDAFSIYYFFRWAYQDNEDVDLANRTLAWICAVVAVFMMIEQVTGRNFFASVGGVSFIAPVREGRVRSTASFSHSILAGTFGATLFPLFFSLWWKDKKNKGIAVIGMVSAVIVAITSSSATPLLGLIAGIVALALWPLRHQMRLIRWGIVSVLVGLQLVMKAPVWALIGRVDVIGGSSSDHRFQLVNHFILRFSDWWLVGTRDPGAWGYGMFDTANTYVDTGVTGGLITFILFILLIACAFRAVGVARQASENDKNAAAERMSWGLGAALFAHVVSFFGITYFDQNMVNWFSLLAMIAGFSLAVTAVAPAPVAVAAERALGARRSKSRALQPSTANTRQPARVKS